MVKRGTVKNQRRSKGNGRKQLNTFSAKSRLGRRIKTETAERRPRFPGGGVFPHSHQRERGGYRCPKLRKCTGAGLVG